MDKIEEIKRIVAGVDLPEHRKHEMAEALITLIEPDEAAFRGLLYKDYCPLTDQQSEILDILDEECGEVVQAIGKIRRFGLYSTSTRVENPKPAWECLQDEIGDVSAAIAMVVKSSIPVTEQGIASRYEKKTARLKKIMRTSYPDGC